MENVLPAGKSGKGERFSSGEGKREGGDDGVATRARRIVSSWKRKKEKICWF